MDGLLIYLGLAWGPVLVAVVAALGIRFTALRDVPSATGAARLLVALVGAIPTLVMLMTRLAWFAPGTLPREPIMWLRDLGVMAVLPLALGVLAVLALAIHPSRTPPAHAATMTRRTMMTFVARGWPISILVVTVVILGLTLAAGSASRPDELGRYTMYSVEIGTMEIGTRIYGWHYSVPALFMLGILLLATLATWWAIARPAWGDDVATDTAARRHRTASVARMTTGALLIHVSTVLSSLGATASIRGMATTSELGPVTTGTPFSAIGPALEAAAWLTLAAGLTLWILTASLGVSARARRPESVSTR